MNYKKLSQQYFDQYVILSLYIKNLKKQAKVNGLSCESLPNRRINLLYTICLELKHTSEYLKNCERREKNVK